VKATDIILAHGHENIQSTNTTTFEVTKETHLTKRGDCIIAVGANKGAADLDPKFKRAVRNEEARIIITLDAGEEVETINAWGSPQLTLTHPTDLVVRKSNYLCDRTLAIRSNKAAKDLSRKLVEKLHNPNQKVKITITVENAT